MPSIYNGYPAGIGYQGDIEYGEFVHYFASWNRRRLRANVAMTF